ncbi:MAG: carbohydrate kinase family protein [Anaerolineae bacterium]
MEPTPRVVVIGAASIDVKGRALAALAPLTSNPGRIQLSIGGAARNIAENLARLGIDTILLSVVGGDSFGQTILAHTAEAGVNVENVMVSSDHPSGAYMALLDEDGRLVVALDEMSAIEEMTPECVAAHKGLLYGADMLIFDGNLPIETMAALTEFAHLEGIPVCVDPTSVTLAPGITPFLDRIDLFMPNLAEAQVFCDCEASNGRDAITVARKLVQLGVDTAVIALGADGVAWASSDESGWIPAFPIDEVVDTVGAGAALTAGVVFGLLNDVPLDEAVRLGASAAALTLQSQETVRPDLSLDLLYEQIMVF